MTFVDTVAADIKEKIANFEFCPADKLPSKKSLIKTYNVSRLTLREALAKLSAWGLIRIRHGKGSYVCKAISRTELGNVRIPMSPQRDSRRMNDLLEALNVHDSDIAREDSLMKVSYPHFLIQ